ncbi:MAG: Zn-dependent oligopeptidase [Fimbriimonadaceae bacterium]|nr:Zn-dependent oligopeptidase [Fimbriimonadaceae bacterium]
MKARILLLVLSAIVAAGAFAQEVPANVAKSLKDASAAVAKIVALPAGQRTFENTVAELDRITAKMDTETSLTAFMQFVSTDAKERENSRAADEAIQNWYIDLGKNEALYKVLKSVADKKPKLDPVQQRLMDFTLRDYRRSGMDLSKEKRDRLKEIEIELTKLSIEFDTNIAEDATRLPLTSAELKGVPPEALAGKPKNGDVYLLGMDGPTYGAIMDYCEVEATRQKTQWLYRRRAVKNVQVLEKLLKLRWEQATLLGYKNTVDYEVEVRMAKNSETIKKFYDDLLPVVRKKALADFAEFEAAKKEFTKDSDAKFMPWDYSFTKNYLMRTKYAVDSQKVSEYFPMERVMEGLFGIIQSLYGVEMRDVTSKAKELGLPIWHEDVKLYEFYDKASGKLLGRLYTDLYPRDNKYNHAACWGLQARRVLADGTVVPPLAALVCNFTKGTAEKPSLLPHDEVETFFHEFGHGLHNLFTTANYARFAGTAVARDFVEAPSQMFENWVWRPEALKTFAKHYKTDEVIPDSLIASMKAARTLGSGIETEGQLFLGNMDYAFHTAPGGNVDTTKVAGEVYEKFTLYKNVPGTFFQAAFGHLTGYQGAYYGYMWSLVYAQDMFQRFDELGVLDPKAGAYYRDKVLARGGTMDEMEMLRDYLGRDPKMDAFLKHLGLGGG